MNLFTALNRFFQQCKLSERYALPTSRCFQLIKSGHKFKRVRQIKKSIQMKSTCLPAPSLLKEQHRLNYYPYVHSTHTIVVTYSQMMRSSTHVHKLWPRTSLRIVIGEHILATCLISITCEQPKTSFVTGRFVSVTVRKRLFLSSKIYRYRARMQLFHQTEFNLKLFALLAHRSTHDTSKHMTIALHHICTSKNKRESKTYAVTAFC